MVYFCRAIYDATPRKEPNFAIFAKCLHGAHYPQLQLPLPGFEAAQPALLLSAVMVLPPPTLRLTGTLPPFASHS